MYAFVDVVDYQKVVVTDASSGIKKAAENYLNDIGEEVTNAETKEKEITITNIKDVIIDSNTYYYMIVKTKIIRYQLKLIKIYYHL